MNVYKVKTQFIFTGEFEVFANSKEDAKERVIKHCGLVIGGDIHSTLPDDEINWNFEVHPNKKILSIKTYIKEDE